VGLLPAAVLIVALVPLLRATRRPPVVSVWVADDRLCVRFGGWDALWVMRRGVSIPVAQVQGVAVAPLSRIPREGLKLPGASIPGVIRAGVWVRAGNRDLWDVRTAERVLWIELQPGAPYRRLILQPPDVHATALELRRVLSPFVPDLAS
jgi:hypothetical protein